MHQSRDVAKEGQDYVDPEMLAEADFEKHADRRNYDREDDANEVCHGTSGS